MYFDGGSRRNPGEAGCGYVVYDEHEEEVMHGYVYLGRATNNVAEYNGLVSGLTHVSRLQFKSLLVRGDSQLVIMQMKGMWKIRNATLKALHGRAKAAEAKLSNVRYQYIQRNLNKRADALANMAITTQETVHVVMTGEEED
jgi:ribonuclease HI